MCEPMVRPVFAFRLVVFLAGYGSQWVPEEDRTGSRVEVWLGDEKYEKVVAESMWATATN